MGKLRLRPISLREANGLVDLLHRHHEPTQGHKFSIGVEVSRALVGAAISSRPVARGADDSYTCEVTRLVTDGTYNACSMLYAASARAARAVGYDRIQTYILEDELGTSLKAAGWQFDGMTAGGKWKHTSGHRKNSHPTCPKQRWICCLTERGRRRKHLRINKKKISSEELEIVIENKTRVVNLRREECDVRIDRSSKYGNPYRIGPDGDRDEVCDKYMVYLLGRVDLLRSLEDLRGLRLGCWCKPLRCHGDILVRFLENGIPWRKVPKKLIRKLRSKG